MSTPHPGTREYRRQAVRIADLTVTQDMIEDVRFENCTIIGPAVLALIEGVSLVGCAFDAPGPEALFWLIPPQRTLLAGAVGLRRVEFYACQFQRVGLALPEDRSSEALQGFGLS